MFIISPIREIEISHDKGQYVYVNRPINMDLVTTFDRSNCTPHLVGREIPSIKFTHGRNQLSEWMFENKEDRDSVFDVILKHIQAKVMRTSTYKMPL